MHTCDRKGKLTTIAGGRTYLENLGHLSAGADSSI